MSRLYHLTKRLKNKCYVLAGIFTNRKPLLEALESIGIEDCYIKGARKSKQINKGSIGSSFENRALEIWKLDFETLTEYVEFRVIEVEKNKINPQLIGMQYED